MIKKNFKKFRLCLYFAVCSGMLQYALEKCCGLRYDTDRTEKKEAKREYRSIIGLRGPYGFAAMRDLEGNSGVM